MTSTTTSSASMCAFLGLALAALGLPACGGSTNDGGSGDSGMTSPPPDATVFNVPDAIDGNDARIIFGGGDTGGPDATMSSDGTVPDGPSSDGTTTGDSATSEGGTMEGGTMEGGPKESGTKDTSTPVDTGPPPACTTVTVDMTTTGDSMCPAPVTGSCGAGSITVTPTAHLPTAAKQGVCTAAEMQTLFNNCLNGGTGACTQDPCYKCIFTDQAAAAWGPVVLSTDNLAQMNVGGCLQLLEPCNSACAATFEEDLECEQEACGTNCPITTSTTGYNNCAMSVDSCVPGCASYYAGTGCQGQITGAGHPGSVCFASTDFQTQYNTIVPLFCGN
jgi:hypothetical protein